MAAPVIGTRPRYAPRSGAVVDRSHPLAQGLEFCFVPSVSRVDLAKGYSVTTTNGTPRASTSAFGGATRFAAASSDYYIFAGVPDAPFLGASSLLWVGVNNSANNRCIITKNENASNVPFDYYIDSTGLLVCNRYAGTGWGQNAGGSVTTGVPTIAVTSLAANIANAATFCINGVVTSVATGGGGSGTPGGTGKPARVGRRSDGGTQADGDYSVVALWGRGLSVGEMLQLTSDPFCFLRY